MTTYTVNFANETPDKWTMCVYQELPGSTGLDSVAWKQTTVPTQGESGVQWSIQYLACLANYQQTGGRGVYKASQKLGTDLGKKWKCIYNENVQELQSDGTTTDGQLLILNESLKLANLGIGMDGDISLVKKSVYSGNSAQFTVKPTYYVALFKDLTKGEVISGNQIHGPLKIVFDGGQETKDYVAKIEGQTFVFEEIGTTNRVEAPIAQMYERIKLLGQG